MRHDSLFKSIDWATILMYIALVVMGWVSIYGASYNLEDINIFDFEQRAGKQLLWIACAFLIAIVIMMIDSRFYDIFAYHVYALIILLLIATIFLAPNIKGSHSWLVIGPVNLQSVELAKFATALALAKVMSRYNFKLQGFKSYILPVFIILLPILCVVLQKEVGSALVFLALFLALYREGMPGVLLFTALCLIGYFILGIRFNDIPIQGNDTARGTLGTFLCYLSCIIIQISLIIVYEKNINAAKWITLGNIGLFAIAFVLNIWFKANYNFVAFISMGLSGGYLLFLSIRHRKKTYWLIVLFMMFSVGYCYSSDYIFDNVLQAHHQTRIKVLLGIEQDLTGAGYNVNQSKIAIGSGRLWGKGLLNGTQTKLKYVPEQDTDFIFCTVGEEHGFVGTSVVLILYLIFLWRLIILAERQRENFSRIFGYCVVSIFFFHFVINVGMALGLAPVIGIPLPFFSYGGSSLWGFTILLFIFLRLDASRTGRVR